MAWLDRVERMAGERPAPRPGRPQRRAGAARAVPLGHRLPLGRVARARRASRRTSRPSSPPTSPTWRPRSTRGPRGTPPGSPRCSAATDDATRYAELSDAVVDAWRAEFLDADGRVTPYTQANLVRALRFGLVPDDLRQQAADDLADLVRKADTHLATGFLATPDLLPALADHGHLDLAYELLFQDTEPSWMTMIDRGATTMWERWEGIDEDGVPHESLNHYSKGAVVSLPAPVRRRAPARGRRPGAGSGCSRVPAAASPGRAPST